MNQKDRKIAKNIAYTIIKEVSAAIRPHVGNPESGERIKIGADGTPTSYIDIIAEDKIVNILKESEHLSYLISEEIGELKIGKGKIEHITLTQELRRTDLSDDDTPIFYQILANSFSHFSTLRKVCSRSLSVLSPHSQMTIRFQPSSAHSCS